MIAAIDHGDALPFQPIAVDGLQVNMPLGTALDHKRLCVCAQRFAHSQGHILIRFKTARTDGGANGGVNVFRLAAEPAHHFAHGFTGNAHGRAAPSCVYRADGAAHRIVQ